jgi:hypothetical protein
MQIPDCLAHLPRWGEFPIPFTTPEPKPGEKPLFRTIDDKKHNLCVRYQLCGACGKHIAQPPYWFHIGPMCVDLRAVFAQPFHEPCARAALTICPWLARGVYTERKPPQGVYAVPGESREDAPPKPTRIALGQLQRYDTFAHPESGLLYINLPPAGKYPIEWWAYACPSLSACA